MNYDIPPNVLALPITEDDMRQTPKPIIVNCVAMCNLLNPNIDAETVTFHLPGFGYNPQSFAAVKIRTPRSMALVFSSSRAVCPGARRITDARNAALKITSLLLEAGQLVCYNSFSVQNIVANCWAPFEIELSKIIEGNQFLPHVFRPISTSISSKITSPPLSHTMARGSGGVQLPQNIAETPNTRRTNSPAWPFV